MIDELVHDALAAQVGVTEASTQVWARIEAAGQVAVRRRRRRTAGGLAAAVLVVGVIVAVGIGQGTPSSEKVATSPTTRAGVEPTPVAQVAPPPAPSVTEPLWQAHALRAGFSVVSWAGGGSWTAARTAGDGRDLVLTTTGCNDRFGAVVQDLGDRVSVQLAVADGPHLQCLEREQVRVRLREPLGGRPLVDGSAGAPGPVLDGATLLVPHQLSAGTRLQTETLSAASDPTSLGPPGSTPVNWQACYQADPPPPRPGQRAATATRCGFDGDRPLVTTAQSHVVDTALGVGVLAQDSIHATYSFGFCGCLVYASGASSPQPGRPLGSTPVTGGVDGHPADLVSTGLHDVVVWTDGTSWYSVASPHGVGGVTTAELLRIARSMRPVG